MHHYMNIIRRFLSTENLLVEDEGYALFQDKSFTKYAVDSFKIDVSKSSFSISFFPQSGLMCDQFEISRLFFLGTYWVGIHFKSVGDTSSEILAKVHVVLRNSSVNLKESILISTFRSRQYWACVEVEPDYRLPHESLGVFKRGNFGVAISTNINYPSSENSSNFSDSLRGINIPNTFEVESEITLTPSQSESSDIILNDDVKETDNDVQVICDSKDPFIIVPLPPAPTDSSSSNRFCRPCISMDANVRKRVPWLDMPLMLPVVVAEVDDGRSEVLLAITCQNDPASKLGTMLNRTQRYDSHRRRVRRPIMPSGVEQVPGLGHAFSSKRNLYIKESTGEANTVDSNKKKIKEEDIFSNSSQSTILKRKLKQDLSTLFSKSAWLEVLSVSSLHTPSATANAIEVSKLNEACLFMNSSTSTSSFGAFSSDISHSSILHNSKNSKSVSHNLPALRNSMLMNSDNLSSSHSSNKISPINVDDNNDTSSIFIATTPAKRRFLTSLRPIAIHRSWAGQSAKKEKREDLLEEAYQFLEETRRSIEGDLKEIDDESTIEIQVNEKTLEEGGHENEDEWMQAKPSSHIGYASRDDAPDLPLFSQYKKSSLFHNRSVDLVDLPNSVKLHAKTEHQNSSITTTFNTSSFTDDNNINRVVVPIPLNKYNIGLNPVNYDTKTISTGALETQRSLNYLGMETARTEFSFSAGFEGVSENLKLTLSTNSHSHKDFGALMESIIDTDLCNEKENKTQDEIDDEIRNNDVQNKLQERKLFNIKVENDKSKVEQTPLDRRNKYTSVNPSQSTEQIEQEIQRRARQVDLDNLSEDESLFEDSNQSPERFGGWTSNAGFDKDEYSDSSIDSKVNGKNRNKREKANWMSSSSSFNSGSDDDDDNFAKVASAALSKHVKLPAKDKAAALPDRQLKKQIISLSDALGNHSDFPTMKEKKSDGVTKGINTSESTMASYSQSVYFQNKTKTLNSSSHHNLYSARSLLNSSGMESNSDFIRNQMTNSLSLSDGNSNGGSLVSCVFPPSIVGELTMATKANLTLMLPPNDTIELTPLLVKNNEDDGIIMNAWQKIKSTFLNSSDALENDEISQLNSTERNSKSLPRQAILKLWNCCLLILSVAGAASSRFFMDRTDIRARYTAQELIMQRAISKMYARRRYDQGKKHRELRTQDQRDALDKTFWFLKTKNNKSKLESCFDVEEELENKSDDFSRTVSYGQARYQIAA